MHAPDVGYTGFAVGRRSCRVEFRAVYAAAGPGADDLGGSGRIGEIQRHQRLEIRNRGLRVQRGEDSLAIGQSGCGGRDWRLQVWHDDRAAEYPCG